MNITNDIEEKFSKEKEIENLAKVIDSFAFELDKFYESRDDKSAASLYWQDRRMKANLLAGKIYKAGYRKMLE